MPSMRAAFRPKTADTVGKSISGSFNAKANVASLASMTLKLAAALLQGWSSDEVGPGRARLSARRALESYERDLRKSPGLVQKLVSLEGRKLACECLPSRRCHGDILVELLSAQKAAAASVGFRSAPSDHAAKQAAAIRRAAVKTPRVRLSIQAVQKPTRDAGLWQLVYVGHDDSRRLVADGAGLCSPGLWSPKRRRPPVGVAAQLHGALQFELPFLDRSAEEGLSKLLADLASGRLRESPFPAEETARLRDYGVPRRAPGVEKGAALRADHGCRECAPASGGTSGGLATWCMPSVPGGRRVPEPEGTSGIVSAASWWGRLAAALQRSGLLVLSPLLPFWVLLFADDFNMTAEGTEFAHSLLAFVWRLVLPKCP